EAVSNASVEDAPNSAEEAENEAPAENVITASLEDFMGGLLEFRSQLSALDQRVRKCVKAADSREIEDCIKEFRVANSLYLEQSRETAERLQQPAKTETSVQSDARAVFQQ